MDSAKEPIQFENFLKVYNLLSNIKISIPKIYWINNTNKHVFLEDFGNLRFDKILYKENLKKLLLIAIESLVVIKNEINLNHNYGLPIYNYKIFKSEIAEFVDYFYPFYRKKNMSEDLKEEFYTIWKTEYNLLDYSFTSFVHKDYNLNNLIYLPNRKNHYQCGILDFQDSFWGEDCWDIFSLLEDSRMLFNDKYNDFFINYYHSKTNKKNSIMEFYKKYHFFNSSRQTRLLGRWVKLSQRFNHNGYLDFINITNKRLYKSLQKPYMKKLKSFYHKIFPDLYV